MYLYIFINIFLDVADVKTGSTGSAETFVVRAAEKPSQLFPRKRILLTYVTVHFLLTSERKTHVWYRFCSDNTSLL